MNLRPGFASEEPEPEEEEQPDLTPKMAAAHYAGMSEQEAADVYNAETLCTSCLHLPVCKVAEQAEKSLSVITRCVAYIPGGE